jgi:hypothetical protein
MWSSGLGRYDLTYVGLRITGRRHKILGAASNEKQTAALRSIHDCADTTEPKNQDNLQDTACGVVDERRLDAKKRRSRAVNGAFVKFSP